MKIGDKVIPIKKSIGFELDPCKEWNNIGKEQGYLYNYFCEVLKYCNNI